MPSKAAAKSAAKPKVVYDGPIFKVTTEYLQEPGGVRARRDIVRHPGSVVVLAVDDQQRVLLERQYRHVAKERLWELPAGRIDPGEKPLQAAKRELLEETGFTARKWKLAFRFWSSPGFLDEHMWVYFATGLVRGEAQPEDDEAIDVRHFPVQQATQMFLTGRIKDAKTALGVFWYEKTFLKGRK